MEPFASFRARLVSRRDELREVGALVDPVRLLNLIVEEFDQATSNATAALLNLTQAARECGYSPDALGRMVRRGEIPNRGRHGAPRIQRSDLPRKPGRPLLYDSSSVASRTQIARAAIQRTGSGERLA